MARATEAELRRQVRGARARDARDRKAGKRALAARYEPQLRRVLVELSNGYLFGFPVAAIPALAGAADADLRAVTTDTDGMALCWEHLDVHLSVPGVLMSSIGHAAKVRELARIAGRARSPAKAAAARRNGTKGGRPRRATSSGKTRNSSGS